VGARAPRPVQPRAADFLGVPRSLRRGGGGAWDRLRQVPSGDQSLGGLEGTLCGGGRRGGGGGGPAAPSWRPGPRESGRLWAPAGAAGGPAAAALGGPSPPFAAEYLPTLTRDGLRARGLRSPPTPTRARTEWGNAQEATSVLTALNHFRLADGRAEVREVGMCGAGFDGGADSDPLLMGVRIGASPDGIIRHGNGTVEVLEVKNHCPFVRNGKIPPRVGDRRPPKNFLIRDFDLERRIPPVYIPQLMMEMLCVGNSVDLEEAPESPSPICASAVMVRQTATRGAILLRLRRDEGWINEMKYWLGQFQTRYVKTVRIPDDDFFWNDDPGSRYRKFLSRTKELSEGVEFVAYVDHGRIQRMLLEGGAGRGGEVPLFLDGIVDNEEEQISLC
jgi:hypothetical protein